MTLVAVSRSVPTPHRTRLLEGIGTDGANMVAAAAATLELRLGGVVITPSTRVPLERELS